MFTTQTHTQTGGNFCNQPRLCGFVGFTLHLPGRKPPVQSQLCQTHSLSTTNGTSGQPNLYLVLLLLLLGISHKHTHTHKLTQLVAPCVSQDQQLLPLLKQAISQYCGVEGRF